MVRKLKQLVWNGYLVVPSYQKLITTHFVGCDNLHIINIKIVVGKNKWVHKKHQKKYVCYHVSILSESLVY